MPYPASLKKLVVIWFAGARVGSARSRPSGGHNACAWSLDTASEALRCAAAASALTHIGEPTKEFRCTRRRQASMPAADVDAENAAVLTVLREADAFYREQQRLGRTVRRGFLDLAKARQQHGAGSISALNLRKDLEAQQSVVPVEDFEKCSIQDLSAATPFRLRRGPPGEAREPSLPEPSERRLRQRNNGDSPSESVSRADEGTTGEQDTMLLFAGMPPPALRKAKREFVNALNQAVRLANSARRLDRALKVLELAESSGQDPSPAF